MATALLLVDVQNEFTRAGGKFHYKVKEVMEKTGMMTNLPPLVREARARGVRLLHAPVVMAAAAGEASNNTEEQQPAMETHAFGRLEGAFQEGSWNARIDARVQPREHDRILVGRSNFSAFQGTRLESILKTERVARLLIAGFLTNVCILETVRDAFDLELIDDGLEVIVLKDCCAAETLEAHMHAVEFTLKLFCNTMTGREAIEIMKVSNQKASPIVVSEASRVKGTSRKEAMGRTVSSVSFDIRDIRLPDVEVGDDEYLPDCEQSWRTVQYREKNFSATWDVLRFSYQHNDELVMLGHRLVYIFISLVLQFAVGQDYAFPDGIRPACREDSFSFGGPNYDVCMLSQTLKDNYIALRTLVAFILGGFICHTVYLWRTRRTNYCQVCGANRNLILNISSLLPSPSDPDTENYEDIQRDRETLMRWATLGLELAILKGMGKIDTSSGRAHLESLDLLEADEWENMVAGDRHTTVWYWIQQKLVYLTEEGVIQSEHRLKTLCEAVTVMRDKANDLMSAIDRDNPLAYSYLVGALVNLNLICLSLYKGVEWAIWYYDSNGAIYKTATMYVDLLLTFGIILTFSMLYDISRPLYNPFNQRPNSDDVPHRVVNTGIRNFAKRLAKSKDCRPSTMFWMKSQQKERKRLGLRYQPRRRARKTVPVVDLNPDALEDYIRFDATWGRGPESKRNLLQAFKIMNQSTR